MLVANEGDTIETDRILINKVDTTILYFVLNLLPRNITISNVFNLTLQLKFENKGNFFEDFSLALLKITAIDFLQILWLLRILPMNTKVAEQIDTSLLKNIASTPAALCYLLPTNNIKDKAPLILNKLGVENLRKMLKTAADFSLFNKPEKKFLFSINPNFAC